MAIKLKKKALLYKILPPRHWACQWISELCLSDPHFLPHLCEQQFDFIHYLCIIKLHLKHSHQYYSLPSIELAKTIRGCPKKTLLRQVIKPYPAGLTSILKRLNKAAFSKKAYVNLFQLCRNEKSIHYFQHATDISATTIENIARLNNDWHQLKLLKSIKLKKDFKTLLFIHDACDALSDKNQEFQDMESLKRINDTKALVLWFNRRLYLQCFFSVRTMDQL